MGNRKGEGVRERLGGDLKTQPCWKMENRARNQEMQAVPRSKKRQDTYFPLESPKGIHPANTLILDS